MVRDYELTGATRTKQFDPHENGCDYYCVNSIYRNGVDWMKVRERSTVWTTEGYIPAQVLHGSARFDAAQDVPPRQVLTFETDARPGNNAYAIEALQHLARQRETSARQKFLFVLHVDTSLR
jgi:hypothetical protein